MPVPYTPHHVDGIFWKSDFEAQVSALLASLNATQVGEGGVYFSYFSSGAVPPVSFNPLPQPIDTVEVLPPLPGQAAGPTPPAPLDTLTANSTWLRDALGWAGSGVEGLDTRPCFPSHNIAPAPQARAQRQDAPRD